VKISAKAGDRVFDVLILREGGQFVIDVDGQRHRVDAHKLEGDFYTIILEDRSYEVSVEPEGDGYIVRHGAAAQRVMFSDPGRRAREDGPARDGPERVVSMMPGRVVRILVAEGDQVAAGQGVIVVEAMKMENEITAGRAGRIASINVEAGDGVESGGELMVIE